MSKQQTTPDGKYYVTPEEFGKIMNMSPFTVREHLKNGVLPGIKIGALWRVEMPAATEGEK